MTPTVIIDTQSEPGSWANALLTPCSFRTVSDHELSAPGDATQGEPSPRRRAGRHPSPKTGGGGIGVCGPLHDAKIGLIASLVHRINQPRPEVGRADGKVLTRESDAGAAAKSG